MKITIRTVLVIIFFITCFFGIEAHEIVMHELPKNNIIPESKINCFYQDIRGNMWYGSENGLFRNDGYNIEVYRTDFNNPDLLSSNQITCITENKNGDIIFGTVRGAYILHRNDNSIHHINDKSIYRSVIRCITVTNDNSIWIAT